MKPTVVLIACACGCTRGPDLASTRDLELLVRTDAPHEVTVLLLPHVSEVPSPPCLEADADFGATIGGVPMVVANPGGAYDAVACDPPELRLALPGHVLESAQVEVYDSSRTIEATYAEGLFDDRSMTLRAPEAWSFHAGDDVRLGWSAPADLALVKQIFAAFQVPSVNGGEGPQPPGGWLMTPTIAGDEIDLTVPGPGANASGTFALWMSVASGDALACSIASCTYGMTWRDDHDLSTSR